uniref:Uncharacterized protein n=1 Tax=Panagrolaimus sp. ES5 TaxID=591445 RepID=A0AC34G099_9BILA
MCFTDISIRLKNASDPEQGYDWNERQKFSWFKNSVVMLGIVSFVAVGSVAANLYVVIYLIMSSKDTKTFDETQKGNKDAQKRLFIFTAIMLINHLAFAVMQVNFVNLSPPWFLLFVSPQLRRCVLRMRIVKDFSRVVKVSQVSQIPSIAARQLSVITTTANNNNIRKSIAVTG